MSLNIDDSKRHKTNIYDVTHNKKIFFDLKKGKTLLQIYTHGQLVHSSLSQKVLPINNS